MKEYDKMLQGKIYNPFIDGMQEIRSRAHFLCQQYNLLPDTDTKAREEILKELVPNRQEGAFLQGPIFFDFGLNIYMGKNSYANFNFTVLDICPIIIGDNVFIGPNVSLYAPLHPKCWQDRNQYKQKDGSLTDREYGAPITIKDNCWICGSVTVCAGVTIGEGCVIGAGSVVTHDIPDNVFAAGNPCRVIRKITEEDRLKNHPELFAENDYEEFIK